MSENKTIKQLIRDSFGSQAKLAELLNMGPMTVSQWFKPSRRVPAEHCLKIVKASDGAIALHELRPDLYPVVANTAQAQ